MIRKKLSQYERLIRALTGIVSQNNVTKKDKKKELLRLSNEGDLCKMQINNRMMFGNDKE